MRPGAKWPGREILCFQCIRLTPSTTQKLTNFPTRCWWGRTHNIEHDIRPRPKQNHPGSPRRYKWNSQIRGLGPNVKRFVYTSSTAATGPTKKEFSLTTGLWYEDASELHRLLRPTVTIGNGPSTGLVTLRQRRHY